MKYIKTLKIDIDKKNFEVIPSVQYDSNTRFLHIQLLNDSVPFDITGCSVILSGVKEDGNPIFNSCDIINSEIGFIQAEVTEQMNAIPGYIDCEIKIYDGEGVLTSKKFTIKVTASKTSREVESTGEFKALTDALSKVNNINNKMNRGESISATQIDKNRGKFDQTYFTDEFLQQMAGNTPVNAVPSDYSITTNKIADFAITESKAKRQILSHTIFSHGGIVNFNFNDSDGTLTLNLPAYTFVCIGTNYIEMSGNLGNTVTINYPTVYDGVNTLWYLPEGKEFKLLNFRDYTASGVYNDNRAILLAGISIAKKTINMNCTFTINGKIPYEGRVIDLDKHINQFSIGMSHIDRKLQTAHLFSHGKKINYIFNHTDKILKIEMGEYPHLIIGSKHITIYKTANGSGYNTHEVQFPEMNDGVNYLVWNISEKKFEIYNYRQQQILISSANNFYIIGTVSFGKNGFVNAIGDYNVNGGVDERPILYFAEPIRYDKAANKLYIPHIYIRSRHFISGTLLKPSICGIADKSYFEFDIPSGFIANTIVLRYNKIKKLVVDGTLDESPFIMTTTGTLPSFDNENDIVIATSVYGNVTTMYPMNTISTNKLDSKAFATFNGSDVLDFDWKNAVIKFPSPMGFVQYGDTYYTPNWDDNPDRTLPIQDNQDGLQWLLFNVTTKKFQTARYTGESYNNIKGNVLQVATFWVHKGVQMLGAYKINGVLFGQTASEEPTSQKFLIEDSKLILPPKLFLVENDGLPIYKSSITPDSTKTSNYKLTCTYDNNDIVKVKSIDDDLDLNYNDLQSNIKL